MAKGAVAGEERRDGSRIDFRPSPRATGIGGCASTAPVAHLAMDVDAAGGAVRGLRAEAQLLRPRRRYRARRRGPAAALRASGGERRGAALRQGRRVLRRRQHPHARRAPRTPTRSTSASSPTRRALAIEDASAHSGQRYVAASTAPRPAAATSSRSPATTSCWSTTALRGLAAGTAAARACCPAPAASRA